MCTLKILTLIVIFFCVSELKSQIKNIDLYISQPNVEECITGIDNSFIGATISISPNPGSGLFKLKINNLISENDLVLTITDMSGKLLKKEIIRIDSDLNRIIDLQNQAKGSYLLSLNGKLGYYRACLLIQ